MELAIERVALLSGLSLVQGIVERRTTVPILGNVLLDAKDGLLQLDATDLEVGIRTSIACNSAKPGTTTLNAHKLFEIVNAAEAGEVSLRTLEKDWVEIKCGRAKFKMMGLDPRSFPAMPKQGDGQGAKAAARKPLKAELGIAADVLKKMITRTIFAVSPDETRYNLSGVYIESPGVGMARMVATDGHRLSMVEREVPGFTMEGGAIMPRKGLAELRKLLDLGGDAGVTLTLESQLGWIKRGATELSMRLVEGEFPDYQGVVPKESKYMIKVSRDSLQAAIKRAKIFSSERYHGVKLALADGGVTISSTTPELGEASETIDADFKGEEFSVGFNSAYLLDALNELPPESDVIMGLSDEVSPGAFTTPADSGYKYVVMPMRL